MTITAIPLEYKGIRFRSSLEADWARTFDQWNWHWCYEPIGLCIDGMYYLPDFYLPNQNVWLEVKPPDGERMHKPARLDRELANDDMDIRRPLVVILRPAGPGDTAVWEGAWPGMDLVVSMCPECKYETFVDLEGVWVCRQCWRGQGPGDKPRRWATDYKQSGELAFWRAPRPPRQRRAA